MGCFILPFFGDGVNLLRVTEKKVDNRSMGKSCRWTMGQRFKYFLNNKTSTKMLAAIPKKISPRDSAELPLSNLRRKRKEKHINDNVSAKNNMV